MKRMLISILMLSGILAGAPATSQQETDLTGIWTGKTKAIPYQMDLFLTLQITQKDGEIFGRMSDNLKILSDDIKNTEIKDGLLSFQVTANTNGNPLVTFRLKIKGDHLTGEWKSTDGVSGKWTAKRKAESTPSSDPKQSHGRLKSDTTGIITRLMAQFGIPGLALAVIDNHRTVEIKNLGIVSSKSRIPISGNTFFQGASVSKAVTAAIVFHCVDQGIFDLDTDVNQYLRSWKVPDNQYTRKEKVTLRRLLSHRAGLPTTNFPQKPGAGDPTLVQILNGQSPALNKPAFPEMEPGTQWQYSNIGYVMIQQILEDNLKIPFVQIAKEVVFKPLGMNQSTFSYPIPDSYQAIEALPHRAKGILDQPMMNRVAQAHGGLMTSADDLALFVIEIMNAYRGKSDRLISSKSARIMVEGGIGIFNSGHGHSISFYHPGEALPGATGWIVGYPHTGQGAVILTNGIQGLDLTAEILSLLKARYNWPAQ